MENKKTKKELENVINQKITENTTARRENEHKAKRNGYYCGLYISLGYDSVIFAPINGYKLKELPNNKPLTLLKAKEENARQFVAFANIKSFNDGSDWITFFDITEEKKTREPSGALPRLGYAWHDARKDEGRIFIVLNKNISSYKIAITKHYQRAGQYNELPAFKRWNMTTPSVEEFDRRHHHAFSSWHRLKAEELDKSGYYLPLIRDQLKHRAKTLKEQKEREQAEKNHADWISSDHTTESAIINNLLTPVVIMISERLQLEKVLNRETFGELEKLREIYLNLADFFKWERFADFNKWGAKLEETKKENNFYIKAIKNNILSKVACYHHYTETPNGYIMTTEDNFWRERYLNNF